MFELAKSIAATSTHYKAHVGAVLVNNGQIISFGVNSTKSHTIQFQYNKFKHRKATEDIGCMLHAELDAIRQVRFRLKSMNDLVIYVYRLMRDGSAGMARPCEPCWRALVDFGIRHVYYSTNVGFAYETVESDNFYGCGTAGKCTTRRVA